MVQGRSVSDALRRRHRAMISFEMDAKALARVRVAASPAQEAMIWLRLAIAGTRHPLHGSPGESARAALAQPDVALLARLAGIGRLDELADLLVPPPTRGTWAEVFALQEQRVRGSRTGRWTGYGLDRLCDGLHRFWAAIGEQVYRPWEEAVAADLAERSRTMAASGVGALLSSLHSCVGWDGATLRVAAAETAPAVIRGRSLVLVPSALIWSGPRLRVPPEEVATLSYPVRPTNSGLRIDAAALSALLGPARAAILRDLGVRRTTTALGARHGIAPSTVSHHLRVLHAAGLIVRRRSGCEVGYQVSDRGIAVIGGPHSTPVE